MELQAKSTNNPGPAVPIWCLNPRPASNNGKFLPNHFRRVLEAATGNNVIRDVQQSFTNLSNDYIVFGLGNMPAPGVSSQITSRTEQFDDNAHGGPNQEICTAHIGPDEARDVMASDLGMTEPIPGLASAARCSDNLKCRWVFTVQATGHQYARIHYQSITGLRLRRKQENDSEVQRAASIYEISSDQLLITAMLVASLVLSLIHPGSPLLPVLTQVAQLKFITVLCIPAPSLQSPCRKSSPQALKHTSLPAPIQEQPRTATSMLHTLAGDECYPSVYVAGLVYSSNLNVLFQELHAILVKRARSARSSTPQMVPDKLLQHTFKIYTDGFSPRSLCITMVASVPHWDGLDGLG
ncbi:hypothetical protein C8J57DRAFT_1651707 [Mycena rebaudengoi]|nr:hypothetical protein C8J57DRAFT_1651707 [Mycena rebaudengoi]